jgi:hypothetical protein
MRTPPRHAPRWSKKTDELVHHIASTCRPGLRSELGHWIESSPRFASFVGAHQDKIRKKLTTSEDEEGRLDVRGELLVAHRILADRRFELAFEAYGAHRVGPDLTASYRVNQRFNLEVTRLRAAGEAGDARLANVIAGKLRQLPGELPNALIILTSDPSPIDAALRLLRSHADQKDDAFFARRGLKDARAFRAQYAHLSGVIGFDENTGPTLSANREARRPIPAEALTQLMRCLA